jgi:uncharacterized membrane protein YccF (DUF307 family)
MILLGIWLILTGLLQVVNIQIPDIGIVLGIDQQRKDIDQQIQEKEIVKNK